jgi:hypothetical protein
MNRVQVRSHRSAAMKGLPIFLLGFTLRVEVIAIVPNYLRQTKVSAVARYFRDPPASQAAQ